MSQNKRNLLLGISCILCIFVFIFSFFVTMTVISTAQKAKLLNVIWGSTKMAMDGMTVEISSEPKVILSIVASILTLVIGIFLAILLIINYQKERIHKLPLIIIISGIILIILGILQFFTVSGYLSGSAKSAGMSLSEFKENLDIYQIKYRSFSSFILGILTICSGGLLIISQKDYLKHFINAKKSH